MPLQSAGRTGILESQSGNAISRAVCIRPALLPLLEGVMRVDSDAWQLFDPTSKTKFRQGTLSVFAILRQLVVC